MRLLEASLSARTAAFAAAIALASCLRASEPGPGNASFPEGLADEPDPVARVVYRGHMPYIELNGKILPPLVNIGRVGDPYNERAIVKCAEAGFKIVALNLIVDSFFKGEGIPCDFSSVDNAVGRVLQLVPDAYVLLSLRFTMHEWAKANPDEQIGYATGPADPAATDEYRQRVVRPSAASARFRALALGVIDEFARHVGAQPWRKRLIGIRPSYGVYSEWHCYGFHDAPDNGLRMQERFRTYMKAKRGIDNAQVPTLAMRRHDCADVAKMDMNGDLFDPAEDQLVIDYYDCLANTMADLLLDMAERAKKGFPGRLVGAYYGYLMSSGEPEGMNVLLDKVLSSPDIDFLSNPPFYQPETRRAGGSYAPRTFPSAFRRYGKLSLLEDDSRFHHIRDWLKSKNDGLNLATASARETEMNMRRNWLNQFFDGDGIQLYDPITQSGKRPHAFDDPAVFKAVAEADSAMRKAGLPDAESGNSVAFVMSPRERLRQDGGAGSYFTAYLYQTTLLYAYRSGAAFDLLTLEDYLAAPRRYTTVVFMNTFYLKDAERAILTSRMRKPGMTAVWIGPAGGVTDSGFDDSAMSALTGISAEGMARRPRVVCRDSAAQSVCGGKAFSRTLPSGARSIIVPEPPRSPEAYAEILKESGAWLYTTTGSYFRRHGDVFMFHTGTVGKHTIQLPEKGVRVRELFSGTEYDGSGLALESDGPYTWLFKIER